MHHEVVREKVLGPGDGQIEDLFLSRRDDRLDDVPDRADARKFNEFVAAENLGNGRVRTTSKRLARRAECDPVEET